MAERDRNDDIDEGIGTTEGARATVAGGMGGDSPQDGGAAAAEGTTGAVGEMDFTGAPAGPGGGGRSGVAGESQGGGPGGGGAISSGGTGPGVSGPGPQSAESTLAALGDRELANENVDTGVAGGSGGAGGTGGAGGNDAAAESAQTKRD